MELAIDILRFVIISHLLILIAMLLQSVCRQQDKAAFVLFCFSAIGYLIADWNVILDFGIYYIFIALSFVLPLSFWLFSKSLFDDNFRFAKWMWILMGGIIVVNYTIEFQENQYIFSSSTTVTTLFGLTHYAISLIFVIMAIVEAVQNRATDLIESRLKFRNYFIILTAVIMVFTILSEIAFQGGETPIAMDLIQKILVLGLVYFFTFNRLKFDSGFFRVIDSLPKKKNTSEFDKKTLHVLEDLMHDEKYYKTEGLSIRQLASHLNLKEYKLRKTINQHMGYRNFNEFLNSYRIEEACQILSDPEKQNKTVLEIAYDMGYQSIAPFNKGFKQLTGKTPTEWRKSHISINPPRF